MMSQPISALPRWKSHLASLAVLAALSAHSLASMQEMGDDEIQSVVGQDGLSIVLSSNFGYRHDAIDRAEHEG